MEEVADLRGGIWLKLCADSPLIMPSEMEVASQHWTDWTDWTDSTVEKIEINRKI